MKINSRENRSIFAEKYLLNPSIYKKYTYKGFTLSEVLITLGIIGIVAALTIPTLISKYREKATITKVKESYSMLAQAYQFAVNENGSPDSWKFGSGMYDAVSHQKAANYLKPYLKLSADCVGKSVSYVQKYCSSAFSGAASTYFSLVRLHNGAALVFRIWYPNCDGAYANTKEHDTCGSIYVLTEPMKSSEHGKTQFAFYLTKKGVIPFGGKGSKLTFEQACNPEIEVPYPGFSANSNMYACTAWVIYNNNMDYLKCPGELSWDGKHSCDE